MATTAEHRLKELNPYVSINSDTRHIQEIPLDWFLSFDAILFESNTVSEVALSSIHAST